MSIEPKTTKETGSSSISVNLLFSSPNSPNVSQKIEQTNCPINPNASVPDKPITLLTVMDAKMTVNAPGNPPK